MKKVKWGWFKPLSTDMTRMHKQNLESTRQIYTQFASIHTTRINATRTYECKPDPQGTKTWISYQKDTIFLPINTTRRYNWYLINGTLSLLILSYYICHIWQTHYSQLKVIKSYSMSVRASWRICFDPCFRRPLTAFPISVAW